MRKKTKKTKKKATKVKRKLVKSKKKKTKKKVKRSVKKKKRKKRKKRKTREKVSMEDLYSIINKVQFGKRKIVFATTLIDAATMENTIKDAEVKYKKEEMKKQVVFTLYPKKIEEKQEEIPDFEIMDDEIPDIGQIFG